MQKCWEVWLWFFARVWYFLSRGRKRSDGFRPNLLLSPVLPRPCLSASPGLSSFWFVSFQSINTALLSAVTIFSVNQFSAGIKNSEISVGRQVSPTRRTLIAKPCCFNLPQEPILSEALKVLFYPSPVIVVSSWLLCWCVLRCGCLGANCICGWDVCWTTQTRSKRWTA